MLAVVSLGFAALAQSIDQFQQMRTNQGEEMRRSGNSNSPFGYQGGGVQYDSGFPDAPRWYSRRFEASYHPPLPPALGDDLPYARMTGAVYLPAAEFSREVFYGPYAALVARHGVSAALAQRVSAYRNHRDAQLRDINTRFDELRDATPAVWTARLAELARQQDGGLRALAAEAESIRNDLAGQYPRSLVEAQYQYPGLSIEQRLLLPEIAYGTAVLTSEEAPPGTYLYFLPATARIKLPANLDEALQAKIQAFAREKEELKSDLRTAVVREEYRFSFHREQRLAEFARAQAPRFAALEALAEDIRLGLARYNSPDQPEPPALPTDLAERVTDFQRRKVELQREFAGRLRRLRAEYPQEHFATARQGDALVIVQTGGGAKPLRDVTEFNASLAERCTTLARDTEALRRDIQHYAETHPKQVAGDVDQVATQFAKAYVARQTWSAYRDYFRAVLQPGLSPAQRRVVFQAAAEQLDQAGWLPRR